MASPARTSELPSARAGIARIEVSDSLAAVETVWRALERDGVSTPYGCHDWVAAFAGAVPGRYRFVVVRDLLDRPAMLLPLVLERRFGVTVASAIGGKHANLVAPAMLRDCWERIGTPDALLREIGAKVGADVVRLDGVPLKVEGVPNLIPASAQPGPNDVFGLPLGPTPEASLGLGLSGVGRKKLRAKERHLAELGTVDLLGPVSDERLDDILEAFHEQKRHRFQRLGIANPFSDPTVRRFLRDATRRSPGASEPAVEVYCLTLDGRPVAIIGGAIARRRFSGMFISFDDREPRLLRCSPGEILLARTIARATERGFLHLDLGVGDAFYKRLFCTDIEPTAAVLVPIGLKGRVWAGAAGLVVAAKRRVKRSAVAMRVLSRLRRSGRGRPDDAEL